jgi:tetratricopeptide (TPR) repeat protein
MHHRKRFIVCLAVVLLGTTSGCKQSEPQTAELFQAQWRGLAALQTGQLADAETQFKTVIALAPKQALGYSNLGLTYLRGSRYADAERQLRRARQIDPSNPEVGLTAAKLYSVTGRATEARSTLEELDRANSGNAHVLYALAELDAQQLASDTGAVTAPSLIRYQTDLNKVAAAAPTNLAVRLKLADVFMRRMAIDSALRTLEDIRRVGPELPADVRPALDTAMQLLRAGKAEEARPVFARFMHAVEGTAPYQASLDAVKWLEGPLVGSPVLTFTPQNFVTLGGIARRKPAPDAVRFADATSDAGLPESRGAPSSTDAPAVMALGDYDGDGTDDLFASWWSPEEAKRVAHLYHVKGAQLADVTARTGISLPAGATIATFADVDNDGRLDLFVIGGDQRAHLLHNAGAGKFDDVTPKSGITNVAGARKAMFVDLDHDGDLDLLVVGKSGIVVYRNNLDGTFSDVSQEMGFVPATASAAARDAAFGDFDGDGRIDVVVLQEQGSIRLYHNDGGRHFSDATATSGLAADKGSALAVGDYDNDGFLDVAVAGTAPTLWLNNGNGTFKRDQGSADALKALSGTTALDCVFMDYDNDGWLDLLVGGTRSLHLFHNDGDGKFTDRSAMLPAAVASAGGAAIAPVDVDGDGDEDVFVADPQGRGVRLLRNDGGNSNLSMQVRLVGLRTGSGKNNDFGIGSRVEVRAAELHQTRVVTSRVTHFGLGPHLKADVVRIEWTNGLPQTVYFPGTDKDVTENEVLKGSCAFLYTWDGKRFRFVTDVMWRSALGMPLGLLGSATAYAPAGASQEYLRIPGDALRPRDGAYTLQLTEELWESAYADQLRLLAVDHPDSVDVFVDERFVPPGPVTMRLYRVTGARAPLSAVDDRGNDVLPALRATDDVYVSNLAPLEYQGVVEPHDLVLDLGPDAGRDSTMLFLRGWIYPTDASINVARSQQPNAKTLMPSLEVRDAQGRWTTALPNIGFPSGKDKLMVVDLSGRFPTRDHHVRIRTNLQIYWDQAFVARDRSPAASEARVTPLRALAADLHVRGYSRTYRKGGRYGPWWFDYDSVSTTAPWRRIQGAFTRLGDVLPLLDKSDDMYVIMAPGDEITLRFDASSAAALPAGWRRDFLLYTDGWIKDSDLNTAFGTTVGPLPFHAIQSYPYAAEEAYPSDSAHQRYLREYNTRMVVPGRAR